MAGTTINEDSIAFTGFGEAARAFLDGWRTNPGFRARISAYDIKTDSPDMQVRAAKRADYAAASVIGASTASEAVAGAEAVFSVVTADQAHLAALAALPGIAIRARRRPRPAARKLLKPSAGAMSTSR
jgi:3-hydroxyisobutyrate dehydrogenase-like beta-hydroxyacid dehydrogenase